MSNYDENPLAPRAFTSTETATITHAIPLEMGTLIAVKSEHDSGDRAYFFSPRSRPQSFYLLMQFSNGDGYYIFDSDSSPDYMHLMLTTSYAPAFIGYFEDTTESNTYSSPRDAMDAYKLADNAEKTKLQEGIQRGDITLFGLPEDHNINSVFTPPPATGLKGKIVLTRSCYSNTCGQFFIPDAPKELVSWISFFDTDSGEELSYTDLTRNYQLLHKKTLLVQIGDNEKHLIDFSGTQCISNYDQNSEPLIKKLVQSGRIPCVPREYTRLVTPLTADEIFPEPLPSQQQLLKPRPAPPAP